MHTRNQKWNLSFQIILVIAFLNSLFGSSFHSHQAKIEHHHFDSFALHSLIPACPEAEVPDQCFYCTHTSLKNFTIERSSDLLEITRSSADIIFTKDSVFRSGYYSANLERGPPNYSLL